MATAQSLVNLLLSNGRRNLAEAVGISEGELSKKLSGESNWSLEQLAKALNYLDVTIIVNAQTKAVPNEEYAALKTFAKKYFEQDS